MKILLQMSVFVLGVSLFASVSSMTSDPTYYSQTPLHGPRYAGPLPTQSYHPRAPSTMLYSPRSVVSLGRPYDVDYTGRQLRYRGNNFDVGYSPVDSRVASSPQSTDNTGYFQTEAMRNADEGMNYQTEPMRNINAGMNYRKMSYEAPAYADDQGRIAGKYLMVGSRMFGDSRHSRPYPVEHRSQAYMEDASII